MADERFLDPGHDDELDDDRDQDREHEEVDPVGLASDLLTAGPGLVRLAAGVGWRMSRWAMSSGLHTTNRLVRAALEGESVAHLTGEAVEAVRSSARELLGLDLDEDDQDRPVPSSRRASSTEHLRQRGDHLLAASADVTYDEPNHPAYDRILDELAPDEARILRLLARDGPQPTVDVRSGGAPVAQIGSSMVAPGLSMIGAHAGVRYEDRVPAYLNNLFRLGLVWFSREPVDDLHRYQVLEAQPDVAEALRRAGRGRTVRRSIHLTPFGEDFCRVCLPQPRV